MLGNSYFGFSGDGTGAGGTITGGGTLNYIALFTPSGIAIGDSIMNQVTDPDDGATTDVQIAGNFIPDSTASARKLGASTRRWDTIYMASNIDYSNDLLYKSGGSTYFRMSTTGNMYLADNKNIDVENVGSKIFNLGIQYAEVINIGTGLTPKTINVGSAVTLLDNINIYGNVFNQQVTNLLVKDKLFTVNDGGAVASGFNAGFQIDEGGVNTGWFMTSTTRDGWDFKAPAIAGIATLGLDLLTTNRTAKIQDASGTLAYLSDITGSINGTLNYVAMFTPSGNAVGNAPIKIGSTTTRSAPVNGGTNAIAIGYDSTLAGSDNYSLGYNISHNGTVSFLIGHDVSIDNTSGTYGDGNIYSFGQSFTITGGTNVDSVVNLGFVNTINATSETRGVYILGDSHTCTDFVTFCTLIGESCNFTRADHSTAIGIFTNLTDVSVIYTYGESNTISDSNTIINFGSNNTISSSTNLSVFGSGNTITDSDKLYIGNNNNNMVVDGLTGYVGIGTTTPIAKLQVDGTIDTTILGSILDNLGGWFHTATVDGGNGFVFLESGGSTNVLADHRVDITGGDGGHINVYNALGVQKIQINGAVGANHLVVNNDAATGGLEVQFDGTVVAYQDLGVGIATPIGKINVFGMSSNINQRLEPVAGVTEDVSGATVNTSDATTTTLQTIAIPTDTIYMIEARITARKTAGAGVGAVGDGNGYIRTAVYANIGGVVTLSGAVQTSFTGEGIGAFNATLTISGTDVLVRVTGSVNDDVTWNTITRIEKVG